MTAFANALSAGIDPNLEAASKFYTILQKNGVVANGSSDDSGAIQNAILEARSSLGGQMLFPNDITSIKLNNGISLLANSDRLISSRPILLDFSSMSGGVDEASRKYCINVDGTIVDTNQAPLFNILNGISGFRVSGGNANFQTAIKFGSSSSFAYYGKVKNCSFDNFSETVTYGNNAFGIKFEDVAIRSATGTLIHVPTGLINSGERLTFINCQLYNSRKVLLLESETTTVEFDGCSLDYNGNIFDQTGGHIIVKGGHIEGNTDVDYWFKLNPALGKEGATQTIIGTPILFTASDKPNFPFGTCDATNLAHGGIVWEAVTLGIAATYQWGVLIDGNGRAIMRDTKWSGLLGVPKTPMSRYQNLSRNKMDANGVAEWTLSGTVPPVWDGADGFTAGGSLLFPAATTSSSAVATFPCEGGRTPLMSLRNKIQNHTAGQGKLQFTYEYLDSKGSVISSTGSVALTEGDANTAGNGGNASGWNARRVGPPSATPPGTRNVRITITKSADTSGLGTIRIDDVVFTVI